MKKWVQLKAVVLRVNPPGDELSTELAGLDLEASRSYAGLWEILPGSSLRGKNEPALFDYRDDLVRRNGVTRLDSEIDHFATIR
jgi:hypothetical protein